MKKIVLSLLILIILFAFFISQAQNYLPDAPGAPDGKIKSSREIASFFRKTKSIRGNFKVSDLEFRLAVNFRLDSDVLTGEAKAQLDSLAKVLLDPAFHHLNIELAGHTCDLGSAKYNLGLSRRRVNNAAHYLQTTHRINPSRITTRAYGETMPLIPGAQTEQERSVNRRVVVYLPENRPALEDMIKKLPYTLGFRWAVFRYGTDKKQELVNYDGSSVLKSNDEYRVFLRPARQKYVYLYQIDSQGKGEWIFPRDDLALTNPLKPGEYFLPGRDKVFVLDENAGKETIYLVVTDQPAEALEALRRNDSARLISKAVTQTVKTRGLKKIRIGPAAESPDLKLQEVVISSVDNNSGEARDPLQLKVPQNNVANIMAQYREFLMVLEFEHK